jgi:intein-encoded DNA endonuclease-like protein
MSILKKVNTSFFRTWSSEMAYILGFFATDGTMMQTKRGGHYIEFHITDLQIIRQIKNALHSEHKISSKRQSVNWKLIYKLQIGSKEMFNDLFTLGFTVRKSNTLRFPKIPFKYINDFVRGYFDGDGCVSFTRIS